MIKIKFIIRYYKKNKMISNETDKRLVYLLNVLNVHSKITNELNLNTTFLEEAKKRNLKLDHTCLNRKCSLTQDDISFLIEKNIHQYVSIPFTIINKDVNYTINKFRFYSISKIIKSYNKYLDIYNIAFSAQLVNNNKMIYLSCIKGKKQFFLRCEDTNIIVKNLNKNNVKLNFERLNFFSYFEIMKMIVNNKF